MDVSGVPHDLGTSLPIGNNTLKICRIRNFTSGLLEILGFHDLGVEVHF